MIDSAPAYRSYLGLPAINEVPLFSEAARCENRPSGLRTLRTREDR